MEGVCDSCRPLFERLEKRLEQLEVKNAELEARLRKYENAHTPPSLRGGFCSKTSEVKDTPGREKGHQGAYRAVSIPTGSIEVLMKECPHCAARLGKPFKIESRIVEEVPEPQPVEIIEYRVGHYQCPTCNTIAIATHPDLPRSGRFGIGVLAQTALLKYEERLPLRKICTVLTRQHGITVTPAAVLDFTRRVSDTLQDEYTLILSRVRTAPIIYVDETSINVQGNKYWIWTFTTRNETFFVIRKSRGLNVLVEVLKKDFAGIIVCDGWKSYSNFTKNIQRCWAHLLREADFVADKAPQAQPLAQALHNLYHRLTTRINKDPPPTKRTHMLKNARACLTYWLNKPWQEQRITKFANKVRYGMNHWFTFVLNPGVEPTNNRAERALREHVVQRKIIGTLRNEKGTHINETIMTVLATWKQQGLNPYKQLKLHLN